VSVQERNLVRLTNAGSQMEAGALREYLEQNDIFCFIQGEQHSSIFGAANVVAVELNLLVPPEDLERAHELVVAFREGEPIYDEEQEEEEEEPEESLEPMRREHSRRKALILAFFPSFGCSHLYSGAWGRAVLLAGTQFLGMTFLVVEPIFAALVPLAVITDALGGTARVRATQEPNPPPMARVVSRDRERE